MVCILYRSEENDKKTNPVCFQNNAANVFLNHRMMGPIETDCGYRESDTRGQVNSKQKQLTEPRRTFSVVACRGQNEPREKRDGSRGVGDPQTPLGCNVIKHWGFPTFSLISTRLPVPILVPNPGVI